MRFFLNGNGRIYGRMDTPSYRDARTHLKTLKKCQERSRKPKSAVKGWRKTRIRPKEPSNTKGEGRIMPGEYQKIKKKKPREGKEDAGKCQSC